MNTDSVQIAVVEDAKAFVDAEIRPYVNDFEKNGGIPLELIQKMAANGYLAAPFPQEYDGLGLDPVYYGMLTEVFGKACTASRSLITVHTSLVGETLLRLGTEDQITTWIPQLAKGEKLAAFALSEPEIGSDAKNIKTSWHEEDDCYVLNGVKKWITFGHIADVLIVFASNNHRSTAFLVEKTFPGVETKLIKDLMAARATYLAEIHLDNVRVPKKNILGKLNHGWDYVASTALDFGRYSIAWAGIGIAQEALDAMVTYSRTRSQFGQTLRHFQLIRGMIGDAVTKIHAARALCLRAGELRRRKSPDATIETTISKYFASKVAVEVSTDALQIHGANGFTSKYPVERLYREAKVLEIIEGSNQIQQEIISEFGLKKYFKRTQVL